MRRIKSFKIFESELLLSNENYVELKEILQSKIFDEFDIISEIDFTDFNSDFDIYPEHKFWSYVIGTGGRWTCNSDITEKIVAIAIFNVRKEECNSINTILDGLKVQVDELIGFDLQYSVEEYSDVFSDYTIRLV